MFFLATLWGSLSLASPAAFRAPFLLAPVEKKRKATYSVIFISSRRTHPANRLQSPFVINTSQGHLKSIFCSVLFFPPRMERAPLPLRVYVPLFHWHWLPCHTAQLISKHKICPCYPLPLEFFPNSFSDIISLFGKNKGSCQNSDLAHNLFPDDIWPKNSAFWLSCCWYYHYTSFPSELRPAGSLLITKCI